MPEERPPEGIDLSDWVAKARADPVKYRQRQVTEILLNAIALTPELGSQLYLKGGILMALAYNSQRTTGDVDFSIQGPPEIRASEIRSLLDRSLQRAAAVCGYPDLVCRVQGRIRERPRPETFHTATAPALEVTIGSAMRGTNEEVRLGDGRAIAVLRVDISFREPVETMQRLVIDTGRTISAYGLPDLVAEKYRAILQQRTRSNPGTRRQDVYDITMLLQQFPFDTEERKRILAILVIKCEERGFTPDREMIGDAVIVERLRRDWPTLEAELENPLPDFDASFAAVKAFYDSLPWTIPFGGMRAPA